MSSSSSSSAIHNPTNLVIDTTDEGTAISYQCEYHQGTGAVSPESARVIDSYYDLTFPCDTAQESSEGGGLHSPGWSEQEQAHIHNAMTRISSSLVDLIAIDYNLYPNGTACVIPDTSKEVWLLGDSSAPDDSEFDQLPCQQLTDAECCVVIHAPMTFWTAGNEVDPQNLMKIVQTEINELDLSPDYQARYIGSVLDLQVEQDQRNNIPPAVHAAPAEKAAAQPGNGSRLTVVGGVVLAGLIAVFLGMFVVLYKRQRTQSRQDDIDAAVSKSEDAAAAAAGGGYDGNSACTPTLDLEVDVLSDDMVRNTTGATAYSSRCDPEELLSQEEYLHPSSFTFDLANSMKQDVFGTHGDSSSGGGPTSIPVVPPYPMMTETSDSEADSWAQTDGTVGSLEERLEEITAEI